jgi:hypothetical protein
MGDDPLYALPLFTRKIVLWGDLPVMPGCGDQFIRPGDPYPPQAGQVPHAPFVMGAECTETKPAPGGWDKQPLSGSRIGTLRIVLLLQDGPEPFSAALSLGYTS